MSLTLRRIPVGLLDANCYVLSEEGREDCLVIDPGGNPERVLAQTDGRKIAAILLTHGQLSASGRAAAACPRRFLLSYLKKLLFHEPFAVLIRMKE